MYGVLLTLPMTMIASQDKSKEILQAQQDDMQQGSLDTCARDYMYQQPEIYAKLAKDGQALYKGEEEIMTMDKFDGQVVSLTTLRVEHYKPYIVTLIEISSDSCNDKDFFPQVVKAFESKFNNISLNDKPYLEYKKQYFEMKVIMPTKP